MKSPRSFPVVATLLVLLAVVPWAVAAAASPDGALREVTLQLKWKHQFQFAGYYAAVEQGFYRDVGLDVTLVEYAPGVTPIDQLLGGRAAFAVSDTGALLYRAAGSPIVALAAIFQHSPSVLVTLEASGIRELSQFRGRRVMLSGGFMNAELMAMLETAGVGSDDIVMVPSVTDIAELLEGRVDAFNGYTTNELYELQHQGIPYRVFHPADYGIDFYGDLLLTTETLLRTEPELVRDFRAASLRGWAWAVENPEAAVDLVLAHYNSSGKSREHLLFEAAQTIDLILPQVVPIGYMNGERWRQIAGVFQAQGLMGQGVDLSQFLYEDADSPGLLALLWTYRVQLGMLLAVAAGLLMALYILGLRRQVNSRTRELTAAKALAEQEARTDALTGLPNRRRFFESLERQVAQAQRSGLSLAVMIADIDHFKRVNDRYGHGAGDEVLRTLGEVLRLQSRSGDLAARIGGEEFGVICLNIGMVAARTLAERLRQRVEQQVFVVEGDEVRLSLSVGIALLADNDTVSDLMQKADAALYQAKQAGRNAVRLWSADLSSLGRVGEKA